MGPLRASPVCRAALGELAAPQQSSGSASRVVGGMTILSHEKRALRLAPLEREKQALEFRMGRGLAARCPGGGERTSFCAPASSCLTDRPTALDFAKNLPRY
jgi:hypothetical protein